MNEAEAMAKAAWFAAKQGPKLLNILCRKCRMKYIKAYQPKSKDEAKDLISPDPIQLCKQCKARCDALGNQEWG